MINRTPGRTFRLVIALAVIAGLVAFVETHHAIPAFRAWTFGLFFLFVCVAAALAGGRLRDALLVCAAFAFGITVIEAGASILEKKSGATITQGWAKYDKVLGWELARPGVIHAKKVDLATGRLVYEADYTVDDKLDRIVKASQSGPAVIFFGDSYTFGDGVSDAETMPQRFADLFEGRQRTVNLAVTGYSPQQFLRAVETGYKDAIIGKAPVAFVFLTSSFHAARTACKEPWTAAAPRYALVDGKVTFVGACQQGLSGYIHEWLANVAAYRLFLRPLQSRLTHDDVALYIRILGEAAKVSRDKYGIDPLVPYLRFAPHYLDGTGYDDDTILHELAALGVNVVDMTLKPDPAKRIEVSIPGDGHPTAYANKIRAGLIRDALGRTGGIGGVDKTCGEWTDGCVVCVRRADGAPDCSLPGIACQPGKVSCRRPESADKKPEASTPAEAK